MADAIGKVTATENKPTSCNKVRFWVERDVVIRPFDIVRVPHLNDSLTYAIVQDLQYITDSAGHLANYVSSDFGDLTSRPQNERLGTTIAEAEVLSNSKEIEMPVRDGAIVEWADVEGIRVALGLGKLKAPIAAGWIETSNNKRVLIEFDAPYLLGPEGAHLNIAGISGLATKTSYAMFLLNSIQQQMGDDVTIIIFNVKGRDLLAISEPDPDVSEGTRSQWEACGLTPEPFKNVKYLYPYANRPENGYTVSRVDLDMLARQQREECAFNYFYDVETGQRRLPLLLSDIEDPSATMESIVHSMLTDMEVESWSALRKEIKQRTKKGSGGDRDISVMSYRKFSRLVRTRTEHDLFTEKAKTRPEERRQVLLGDAIRSLTAGSVLVVDIEPLPEYLKCLVFGDVIQTLYGIRLGEEEGSDSSSLGTVVVFADELNKYAPKSSGAARPLTTNLLEITERGRSLGVILFGAEQFRSGVHERILGNCSTNVYGRTSPVELAKCQDYRYFPDSHKSALTRLPQGHLMLQHVLFRASLIKVRFPFPCYYQPKGTQ